MGLESATRRAALGTTRQLPAESQCDACSARNYREKIILKKTFSRTAQVVETQMYTDPSPTLRQDSLKLTQELKNSYCNWKIVRIKT